MNTLYNYLTKTYKPNEPIFLSNIQITNLSPDNTRQQLKNLTDAGKIKRFDKGIYFLPKQTIFKSGSQLNIEKVLEAKYLKPNGKRLGYLSGLMFCNQLGLTTQIPMLYEIVFNKATTQRRKIYLGKSEIIIRKPKITITEENYKILQFLDLIKDIDIYAEINGIQLQNRLRKYMNNEKLTISDIKPYFSYYPDKLYKNLIETGVIYNGYALSA